MSFNPAYYFPTIITNITNLNGGIYGVVKPTDVYAAVDVTDFSQSPQGTTKPYQIVGLFEFIISNLGIITYAPVLAATTGNLVANYSNGISGVGATLTNSGMMTPFVIDGIAGVLNGRYLVKNQTAPADNGIYTLTNVGTATTNWVLTRSIDFNRTSNIFNLGVVYVLYGFTQGGTPWQDSYISPLTVGTTAINWNPWTLPSIIVQTVLDFAGNPNGNVAGLLNQFCWDTVDTNLWICTVAGNAASAVWLKVITLVGGTGITISQSGGTITVNSSMGGGGLSWEVITTSQNLVSNHGYICNSSGLLTLPLPATSVPGDVISTNAYDTGLFQITQGTGQQVRFGTQLTTLGSGGSITATTQGNGIELVCVVANTIWLTTNVQGIFTYV